MTTGPEAPLRGSPRRITDLKEAFQDGFVRAVVAASGCVIAGRPEIDEGVDLNLTHRAEVHQGDGVARLEVQLKATSSPSRIGEEQVGAQIRRDRYDYFRVFDPTIAKIVVILALPSEMDGWVLSSHDELSLRHCAYWVNLAGSPDTDSKTVTIHAPKTNIFDDHSLCAMMERIGQGGAP
ncbi:DUF4365 domain-containing protein [Aeromicrobium sp.]|uniref:DUF4365 domain-containing protein n=1 Tax=Aeromicrobium sp. TaxID=1871063 RepID=UPI0030C0FBBD